MTENKFLTTPIPISREVLLSKGNFPIIDRWFSKAQPYIEFRREIGQFLDSDSTTELNTMGFATDLIPIMKMWKRNAPDVLSSVSHPEEMDTYKIFGQFNLKLFLEMSRVGGIPLNTVLVNYYDTIPFLKSVTRPFQLVNFGSDFDLFGLATKDDNSLSPITPNEIEQRSDRLKQQKQTLISKFMEQLKPVIQKESAQLFSIGNRTSKNENLRLIEAGLEGRLGNLISIFDELAMHSPATTTVSKFLFNFQRELLGRVFGNPFQEPIEEICDFQCSLFSENKLFLKLVKDTISMLIDARGIDLIKRLVQQPWEGLAIVNSPDGSRKIVTVDDDGQFNLMDKFGQSEKIGEESVRSIIENANTLPMAKLESLALVATGYTLHFGAEYGVRQKIVEALNIQGIAREYLINLRIGVDKEHGNNGILIDQTGRNISLVLLYFLFGSEGMKDLVAEKIGQTSQPNIVNLDQFRQLVAKKLLEDSIDPESDIAYFSKDRQSLFY